MSSGAATEVPPNFMTTVSGIVDAENTIAGGMARSQAGLRPHASVHAAPSVHRGSWSCVAVAVGLWRARSFRSD